MQRQYGDEFTENISDHAAEFAESFCVKMKDEFSAQIRAVGEILDEENPNFNDWCTNLIDSEVEMFAPRINQMASITMFWETQELCSTIELAYNELKTEYDENEAKMREELIIPVNGNQKDLLKQNLIKVMNILPFEVFIEK